jgi:predicted nucleotidyltransferase
MTQAEVPGGLLQILDEAVDTSLAAYRPLRIFLFGSRARGRADRRSDFDIGIDAGREVGARDLADLRDALDLAPTLAEIDVVDLSQVDAEFRQHALRDALVLHDRAA